ncbi:amino acid ABC transporter substrate-binding protein [uncultured Kiloniella sp.]|uniref:amino acid ABC transporter substrate-binding protein n=1 Tax=uncultured Kiloniella sp. TaxID=1133091 RepID=UPI00262FEF8A|nr:amino acid ABC transporter substrate-binding protein [uncultured Kiloniella sp.]
MFIHRKNAFGSLMLFSFIVAAFFSLASANAKDITLERIERTNNFVIGFRSDKHPFSAVTPSGEVDGYSIDLCKGIYESLKKNLNKPDLKLKMIEVTADNRFDYINAGTVDIICSASSWTLERQKKVSFSLLTYVTGAEMLVKDDSRIRSLKNLSGKKAGMIYGTLTSDIMTKRIKRDKLDIELVSYKYPDQGIEALENKEIDAYIADRIILIGLLDAASAPNDLKLVNRFYSYDPYALMFERQSLDFKLLVDSYLAELYRSDKSLELFNKWFSHMGIRSNENILRAMFKLQSIPE